MTCTGKSISPTIQQNFNNSSYYS